LAPAICSLGVWCDIIGRHDKCALAAWVWNVNNLKIPARFRLAEPYARMIGAGVFLSGPTQDLMDFILRHAVIVNVRQSRLGIGPESKLHFWPPFGDLL
jgi:hypothetical protein